MAERDDVGPAAEELDDTALRQEIELLAELLEKVADSPEPLCQDEIDRALHVDGATGGPRGAAAERHDQGHQPDRDQPDGDQPDRG